MHTMQVEDGLQKVFQHLMRSHSTAEDDTVLNKLHSGIHNLLQHKNFSDGVASACKSCGLWDFLQWNCIASNTVSEPSLLCLALKCTTSLVQTSTDLADTDLLQLLQMLSGLVKGGTTITSGNTSNGHPSSIELSSNGNAPVSTPSNGLSQQPGTPQNTSEAVGAAIVSPPDQTPLTLLKHIDCTVVAAALSVVCALVDLETGRRWLETQGLVSSLVAPCLLYPSVFVQRAAMDALTGLLHYASPHTEQKPCPLWDLLQNLSTASSSPGSGGGDKLTPRQLLSIYSSLLDKTPIGECPDWRLQVLLQRCSGLQCSGTETALQHHLTMRLALHQYVKKAVAKEDIPEVTSSSCVAAEGAVLAVVEALLRPQSEPHNKRCWVQLLQLEADVRLVLTEGGASTSFCSALGHLASSLQLLPAVLLCSSSTGTSQQQTVTRAAVSSLLLHCGQHCDKLLQVKEAVQGRVAALQAGGENRLRRQAADAAKGLAAAAAKDITLERCVSLLDQCQQLLLVLLPAADTTCDDVPRPALRSCLLPLVDLLEALLKRLGAQCPVASAELCPALCRLLNTPGNESQLIVGVLNCLRLRLVASEPAQEDADPLLQSVGLALCHTSWEVQDSALELLAGALQLRPGVGVSWMQSAAVQRSVVALLSSDQPFVQCSAAAVLQQATHYCQECEGVEWSAAHHWSVSVCCSSDALAGCETDTVTAAACSLLACLHHTDGLDAGCPASSTSGGPCHAASLLHAQHYCTSDSDLLRAAGQRYLNRHISALLNEKNDVSGDGNVTECVKVRLDRCCSEGSAWCVLQGCTDVVASVRLEASATKDLLQRAAASQLGLSSSSGSGGNTPESVPAGSTKRSSDASSCEASPPKRLRTSPVTHATSRLTLQNSSASPDTSQSDVKEDAVTGNTTSCSEKRCDVTDQCIVGDEKQKLLYEGNSTASSGTAEGRIENGAPVPMAESKEADVILEEVLDFSDLTTLAGLRRPGAGGPTSSLADRPTLPAVPITALIDSPNTETDTECIEEREFLSLLEDIMLGVSATDGPSSPGLVFGPPSHHTMDCY